MITGGKYAGVCVEVSILLNVVMRCVVCLKHLGSLGFVEQFAGHLGSVDLELQMNLVVSSSLRAGIVKAILGVVDCGHLGSLFPG